MGASFAYSVGLGSAGAHLGRGASTHFGGKWKVIADTGPSAEVRGERVPIDLGLRRAREGVPERRLVLAVLLDALQVVAWGVSPTQSRRCVTDAREWIQSDDTGWPFSFVNVCEVLDIEPRAVRGFAAAWIAERGPGGV